MYHLQSDGAEISHYKCLENKRRSLLLHKVGGGSNLGVMLDKWGLAPLGVNEIGLKGEKSKPCQSSGNHMEAVSVDFLTFMGGSH